MRWAHSIKLSVFSYEFERAEEILESFLKLFPFDLEENKAALVKRAATGFGEARIQIFEALLTKTSLVNQFLDNFLDKLSREQKDTILGQAESRLDDNLDFFIRIDKESWMKGNKMELTDSGKCYHIKMSIAAFPSKREVALNIIRELFSK